MHEEGLGTLSLMHHIIVSEIDDGLTGRPHGLAVVDETSTSRATPYEVSPLSLRW